MKVQKGMLLLLAGILIVLTGCRSFTSPARMKTLKSDTNYLVDYDATRRGALIIQESDTAFMLAEPSPDAAVNMVQEYLAKVNYEEIGVEAQASLSEDIVQMGKRTATIMFLRECMYRLSELRTADNLDDDTIALYEEILKASLLMAQAEMTSAEATLESKKAQKARAETELQKAINEEAQFRNDVEKEQLRLKNEALEKQLKKLGRTNEELRVVPD